MRYKIKVWDKTEGEFIDMRNKCIVFDGWGNVTLLEITDAGFIGIPVLGENGEPLWTQSGERISPDGRYALTIEFSDVW